MPTSAKRKKTAKKGNAKQKAFEAAAKLRHHKANIYIKRMTEIRQEAIAELQKMRHEEATQARAITSRPQDPLSNGLVTSAAIYQTEKAHQNTQEAINDEK